MSPRAFARLLAVAFCVVCVAQVFAAQPAATQPATPHADLPLSRAADRDWLERHKKMVARAAEGNVDVVFLGDFFTEGWSIGGKHGHGARGRKLFESLYLQHNIVRFGIRGETTQSLLFRVTDGELDHIQPKAVFLQIGFNNINTHKPDEIAAGVAAIVKVIREKCPTARVILLAMFPAATKPTHPIRARIKEINDLTAKLADGKAVTFLDIGPKLLSADGTLPTDISDDGLNLTPKGYAVWSQAINPIIEEAIGKKLEPAPPQRKTAPATTPAAKPATKPAVLADENDGDDL